MIDWLRAAKSANFLRKIKRLPKKTILDLFRTIRQSSEAPSRNIFRHVKDSFGQASWSALAFLYKRDPAFLDSQDAEIKECICGFLLLVEYRDYVALFRSNLDVPSAFKTEYFARVADSRVEAAIARADATFEQIRLRNMATSKYTLRIKTLEANDLQYVVGPAGANRYVPRGYRVRQGRDHYSANPDSGKISMRSERAGHEELVQWAVSVVDLLTNQNAPTSSFIRTFARPIDLTSIPSTTIPTHFAVDVPRLIEELYETPETMQFVHGAGANAEILNRDEIDTVLAAIVDAFPIRKVRGELRLVHPQNNVQIGRINITKTRISLRKLQLPEIDNIYIQPSNQPANDEINSVPLKRYIDQNNFFTVLFSDSTVVYLDGELYKDDSLVDGTAFLSHISTDANLGHAITEKGTFSPQHTVFDADSVFGVLASHIAGSDEVLVCDDLGDEWADFIGINGSHQPKTISFYHAKYGDLSLSASALHIVVSQAIKNLSRINLTREDIVAKLPKWTTQYENQNVVTSIPRIVKGDEETLLNKVTDALSSPDTIRRVFIVTSSLSRAQLEQRFVAFRGGEAPEPHFVQLYQLLMSYFSACSELGAYAYVVCRQ
jgi:hypothetical protein